MTHGHAQARAARPLDPSSRDEGSGCVQIWETLARSREAAAEQKHNSAPLGSSRATSHSAEWPPNLGGLLPGDVSSTGGHRTQKGDTRPTPSTPSCPARLWLLPEHPLRDGEVLTLGRLLTGKFLGKWPP